jgi:hypothetical protein
LCYDRRSVSQSGLVSSPHLRPRTTFLLPSFAGLLMRGSLPDERTDLSFRIAAGPHQRNHSGVRVPRDSLPYFALSDSRLFQPGGPGLRMYVPQEQGGPGTGFRFRRLLRLAGLRWRYWNPPPRGGPQRGTKLYGYWPGRGDYERTTRSKKNSLKNVGP